MRAWRPFVFGLLSALALDAMPAQAMTFLVTPTRAACGGAERSVTVTVMNRDTQAHVFRLELENRRVTADGALEPLTDPTPEDRTATNLIRLSTRQLTLGAQASGVVRVLCRAPANAEPGEYRSHLVVRQLPDIEPEPQLVPEFEGVSIQITPIYGISMPIMVRSGATSARVSLVSAIQVRADLIQVSIASEGNRSAFVNIKVMRAGDRAGEPVIEARGVPLYLPMTRRDFELPLNEAQRAAIARGARVALQQVDELGAPIGPVTELALPPRVE